MAKKFFHKALSVGLSLALCATLAAPAFAHVVTIDGVEANVDTVQAGVDEIAKSTSQKGTIKMTEDETGNVKVTGGLDVTLDMDGKTLTGDGTDSVITVSGGANLTVDGADATGKKGTITGGNALDGGGVNVSNGNLTMKDSVVTGNSAGSGGGISVKNGSLELEKVDVNKNQTELKHDQYGNGHGNGGGGIDINASDVKLKDVTISENKADGAFDPYGDGAISGFGGGVEINNCNESNTIELESVSITKNESFANGGGMDINNAANVSLKDVTITDNHSGTGGGGMFIYTDGNTAINMENTAIYDNDAYASRNKQANDITVWTEDWENLQGTVDLTSDPDTVREGHGNLDGWTNCWPKGSENPELGNKLEIKEGYWLDAVSRWVAPEVPDTPDTPDTPDDTEIEDPVVPLAGLFTRGDAIGYLWEQSGSPEAELSTFEDVPEDHQWAVAIGWAQDMGIARADEEGNFRPDDLVLRGVEDLEIDPEGELQEFLNWYAQYAGVELDEGELFIELEGALDDVIMGEEAQVIFDDFFARLEAALTAMAA